VTRQDFLSAHSFTGRRNRNGMTNPFHQFNGIARFLERRRAKMLQLRSTAFFGKTLLAAPDVQRAISRSSLPSQNSMSSFGQGNQMFHLETQRTAAAAAHGFQFRALFLGHRMLNWSVFFATPEACQTRILKLMGKMIDNGIHCYNNCRVNVSSKSQKTSGLNGTHVANF